MNVFVFDIETVPDIESGKKIHDLDGLSDRDVIRAMEQLRGQQTGNTFMPHYLQRIVAISVVLERAETVKVWSLGSADSGEKELLERFFAGLEQFNPTLVSWNGSGFDLPVIQFRALLHGVDAHHYWQTGDEDTSFRFNNYLSRYHWRHVDLMDVLAAYQPRAFAKLDHIAVMLGFPGKYGMDGSNVCEAWLAGEQESIRNYCETDALNTYLVWLCFEKMRGKLSERSYMRKVERVRNCLEQAGKPHLDEFLRQWT